VRRHTARGAAVLLALLLLVVTGLLPGAATALLSPRSAPPPTPVPPDGSPSPFVSRLTTPADAVPVPTVQAAAVLLLDLDEDQVLVRRGASRPLPVASLTKLMTALLVLEAEAGRLDRLVTIHPDAVFERGDYGASSTLGLRRGERISVRDLLAGLLAGSANDAAEALAIEEQGSVAAFVQAMNAEARRIGMTRTRFRSPHGLDDRGRSSADDLARLLAAVREHPDARAIVRRRVAVLRSGSGPVRRIQNRNVLLWLLPGATGVKTGFTAGAGYCVIATARRQGRDLAAIVIGGGDEVFSDAAALLAHGFAAYESRTLVDEGESLGTVRVRGGRVPVVAASTLTGLVRVSEAAALERALVAGDGVGFPPPPGAVVGSLRITLGGVPVGRVRLLAADLEPPSEPAGAWWTRAGAAIAHAIAAGVDGLFG
jgi:D-alanyl-D-alanine carboxypeptidase (penicillin-binding protein 5/6)